MEGLIGIGTMQEEEISKNVMQQTGTIGIPGTIPPNFPSSSGELSAILEEPTEMRESVPPASSFGLFSWNTIAQSESQGPVTPSLIPPIPEVTQS